MSMRTSCARSAGSLRRPTISGSPKPPLMARPRWCITRSPSLMTTLSARILQLAASATFCATQSGVFPRFHDSLFAAQPPERGQGWTSAQLQQLGRALGAGDNFTRCVQAGPQPRVATATETASRYISGLRPDHRFGTPSVVVNGALIGDPIGDTGDRGPSWPSPHTELGSPSEITIRLMYGDLRAAAMLWRVASGL